MKPTLTISRVLRVLLGLFLIVYALNQFFHFIPHNYGKMPENTRDFLDAIITYLPYLYVLEIIIGLFLIFNKWTSFILIVLFPLTISFMIFNLADNDFSSSWAAIIVALLNIILMFNYVDNYKVLFKE